MEERKSSNEWWHDHELFTTMRIQDPDGWDRAGDFHHSFYVEEINRSEFEDRLAKSTMVPRDKATK